MDHPEEDHNKQEFKRLITGGILDHRKSPKQEKHHISGPYLNIIASILTFSKHSLK